MFPTLDNNAIQADLQIEMNPLKNQIEAFFQSSMEKAEGIFAKLSTATAEEKNALVAALGEAWEYLKVLRQLPFTPDNPINSQALHLSRIAQLRGDCRWAQEDMEITRQLFSLAMQCARGNYPLSHFGLETMSLEESLIKLRADPLAFASLEDELASPVLTGGLIREALESQEVAKLSIAQAARSLAGTYQNHNRYQLSSNDNAAIKERKILLCENAIRIAETIWETINTPETQWLSITCKYNLGPYCHALRHPEDTAGKRKIYEEVLHSVEAMVENGNREVKLYQQQAQCYNMLMRLQPESSTSTEKFAFLEKAAALSSEHADEGFDQFLVRMFLHNKASFAFKSLENNTPVDGVTIEMIEEWHDQVQKKCAEQEYKHYYDAIFCLNAAKVAHYMNKLEKAKELLRQALKVCDTHPSSTSEIRKEIEELQQRSLG